VGTVANCVLGALGAPGRRFESCRRDSLKPSYTCEFLRLSFLLFTFSCEKGAQGEALESSKILKSCLIRRLFKELSVSLRKIFIKINVRKFKIIRDGDEIFLLRQFFYKDLIYLNT